MLFVPHWLLTQAHFYGWTHLPPSPSSTMSIGQDDIPIITLLILFSDGWSCHQHPPMLYTCGHDDILVITPILSMYLSTTSAVFTPVDPINILHYHHLTISHHRQQSSVTTLQRLTFNSFCFLRLSCWYFFLV